MKTDLFQFCGHCWVFQICWHIECSIFKASSFRIWNSSTGIPSPPLALFIVILPKANLTLHSRMSGSRWMITSSWLSGLQRSLLHSSPVYSYHLFWIYSAFVRSIQFLSFIVARLCMKVPLAFLIFLKRSLVFPILCFSLFLFINLFIYLFYFITLYWFRHTLTWILHGCTCVPLFLCIDHWGRLSYLSLLYSGTLHSNGYIFPFSFSFQFSYFQSYL